MKILTTLKDLQDILGQPFLFPEESISKEKVEDFGKLTGDWNNHNTGSTDKFEQPAVQGFLTLSLFADYHKRICRVENGDPINVQVVSALFLRPVYVDRPFTPTLTILKVEQKKDHIQVIWKYELLNPDRKRLITATIEIRYYQHSTLSTS